MARLSEEELLTISLRSPALKWQTDHNGKATYPASFNGRVPLKVKMVKTVRPNLYQLKNVLWIKDDTVALEDVEYYVWVNSYGEVFVILTNGQHIPLLPSEFEVIKWH